MSSSKLMACLNKCAEIIRARKKIGFYDLCVIVKRSPSTMYGYKYLLLKMFEDIKFDAGMFYVETRGK